MTEKCSDDDGNNAPGPAGSGKPGNGANTTVTKGTRTGANKKTVPILIDRVTALRGLSIGRPKEPKSSLRCQTQRAIYGKDPEIPYVKFETGARDLVCSLMERQDRMNEEIFYRLSDHLCRIEDLELERKDDGGGR
ncbi:MAG: hypothetical protein Q8R70_07680 [Methanoregula sp.]|nr:hypothetical protein [Methanoregula sp.]